MVKGEMRWGEISSHEHGLWPVAQEAIRQLPLRGKPPELTIVSTGGSGDPIQHSVSLRLDPGRALPVAEAHLSVERAYQQKAQSGSILTSVPPEKGIVSEVVLILSWYDGVRASYQGGSRPACQLEVVTKMEMRGYIASSPTELATLASVSKSEATMWAQVRGKARMDLAAQWDRLYSETPDGEIRVRPIASASLAQLILRHYEDTLVGLSPDDILR